MTPGYSLLPRKLCRIRKSFAIASGLILLTIYCLHVIRNSNGTVFSGEDSPDIALRESFLRRLTWSTSDQSQNETKLETCRNTVQGQEYICDERGYLCSRSDVSSSGCCPFSTKKYDCSNCDLNDCCKVYEVCVSCCMQPDNKAVLSEFVRNAVLILERFFVSMSDQFELCLSKCRTSSISVQHENTYRDPNNKFCFGEHPPRLTVQNRK